MNGINILNTVEQQPGGYAGLTVIAVVFGILAIAIAGYAFYAAIETVRNRYEGSFVATAVLCIIGLIFVGLSILLFIQIPGLLQQRETIVYATIDDSVSWADVNSRYELIRQDGKIYQLKVRDADD